MPRGARPWTARELNQVTTNLSLTTNFKHLQPVPRRFTNPRVGLDKRMRVRATETKDRIKWWNIVPGDLVRVIRDDNAKIREVHAVNKITNRVYIQKDTQSAKMDDQRSMKRQDVMRNVHYSNVQLYLGEYEFPRKNGSGKPETVPVFARRLGTTQARWMDKRWSWSRFAVATAPRLPTWVPGKKERISIPWPKADEPLHADPTEYDTLSEVIAEVTYEPPSIPEKPAKPQLSAGAEDNYLQMLRHEMEYDQSIVMEPYLASELSNPHSRIKQRARYLLAMRRRQAELDVFVKAEMDDLKGRTRKEARKEADFKWQQKLKADRKAELKKRWVQRGEEARLMRKRERQRKKTERETRRLRDLVLRQAPNQVLPGRGEVRL